MHLSSSRAARLCWWAVLLLALCAPPARAADSWSTPFTGVRYLYRTTATPWRIHALVIDLCAAGVSARATTSSEHKRTPSSFGKLVGAEAAINGDFFSYSTYNPNGLAVGNSKQWGGADSAIRGVLGFGLDRAELDGPNQVLAAAPSWIEQAVSGYPYVVIAGKAITSASSPSHCAVRNPRTAVGLSRNRRTLYLAVVDGRWSSSAGMTCPELGQLMASLGAYQAVNLDGGGSSAMWIKGKGVVNHPSDGSERVVANHLAIQADGTGRPHSCDYTVDELTLQSDVYGAPSTSDVDGDGKADACARSSASWRCHLSTGGGFGALVNGPALSDASGWKDPSNYGTLRMGDIDGDGRADLCARANAGIRCWRSTGAGFGAAITGPPLGDASGWDALCFASTIRLADMDGDGKDDLCARSAKDFRCYRSTGNGFGAAIIGPALSDAGGWGDPSRYGTLRMGDINGDGKADLCARHSSGMKCWLSSGSGFGAALSGPTWSDATGWSKLRYWSTIRLADVDGDGRADLCARSASDFRCHLSTGSGFGAAVIGPKLSDASGWGEYDNYATIRLADMDGDGDLDLCARGNAGIFCWPWSGAGFGGKITGPVLSDAVSWDEPQYVRTIRFADINGDGKQDICARAADGVRCWPSSGTSFGAKVPGPEWSDALGWDAAPYYSTIHLGGPRCRPSAEICDGKDNDCDHAVDEGGVCGADGGAGDAGPVAGSDVGPVPGDAPLAPGDGQVGADGPVADAAQGGPGAVTSGCGCRVGRASGRCGLGLLLLLLGAWRTGRRRPPRTG